jgi:hypothetical protein
MAIILILWNIFPKALWFGPRAVYHPQILTNEACLNNNNNINNSSIQFFIYLRAELNGQLQSQHKYKQQQ